MDDLCYLSATEALRMFRSRQLSPVELMEAVIARAGEVEPSINAFADTITTPRWSRPVPPKPRTRNGRRHRERWRGSRSR